MVVKRVSDERIDGLSLWLAVRPVRPGTQLDVIALTLCFNGIRIRVETTSQSRDHNLASGGEPDAFASVVISAT